MATVRLLSATVLRALARAVGRWLAGALVVGAVFFGPNGVDPHDVVHHLRGSVMVLLLLAALAAAWIAPGLRAALVAPGTDAVRALPYRRSVLGGALFVGVLAATAPFGVLVVAGGGPGVAFAVALVALVAALQPRRAHARAFVTWVSGVGRVAFAAGSVVLSFRLPIPALIVAGPFGAWTLARAFAEARAPRGAPLRLVPAAGLLAPSAVVVPWSVSVDAGRRERGVSVRSLATIAGMAWLARAAAPRFPSPVLPAVVAALGAAALCAPAMVAGLAASARAHQALARVPRTTALARRAVLVASVLPFVVFSTALGSLGAGVAAAGAFALVLMVLASWPVLVARDALPVAAAVVAVAAAGSVVFAPWAPHALLAAALALRVAHERRGGGR